MFSFSFRAFRLNSDSVEAEYYNSVGVVGEMQQESKILKFLGFMWNPLSWVMEAAALMAIVLANGDGKPPDWEDFVGIVCLLVINSTISFIEENNAGNAAAALMAGLAPKTKVRKPNNTGDLAAAWGLLFLF